MDSENLGLRPDQQAQIDDIFLDVTAQALFRQNNYNQRAWFVSGELAVELEGIHARTYAQAHEALLQGKDIDPTTIGLIAKLAFIDSLELPSAQRLSRRDKRPQAAGAWSTTRRLFKYLPESPNELTK